MIAKVVFSFVVCVSFVTGLIQNKEMIDDSESKLWISVDKFKVLIDASFQESHCCNAHMYDMDGNVEILFNMFTTLYPYSYVINYTSYECKAHLVLAAEESEAIEVVKQIPSEIATLKILVILDTEVNSTSEIFNAALYRNANINLVSLSGLWRLTENYLENREFVKVEKYEELMVNLDAPNLRGRELQISSYYKPPHSYLNRTVNRTIKGVKTQVFLADDDLERDGMEVKIMMLLAEKLNFTWTVRQPTGIFRYGRKVNGTTWSGGMIEQLVKKEVDMAFGGIWLTEDVYSTVNLTEPWHEISINFLVPRPRPYTSFWALTRPFSPNIWIAVVSMLLSYSTYLCIRAWINPKIPRRYRHFLITLTELSGRLTGTWCPRNTDSIGLQLHLWQTTGLLIVCAYSSSLAARLTNAEYEKRIDTVEQFIKANLTWGRQGPEPNFPLFFNLKDPYAAQLPKRFHHEKNAKDRHRKIAQGNYALIGRMVDTYFFPDDEVSIEDLRGYRVMESSVGKFYVSFAVQPWLFDPVNKLIYRLREAGILSYILHDVLRRRAGTYMREVRKEYDTGNNYPRVLSLTPLGAGFAVLATGLIISSIIFYFELRSVRGAKSSDGVVKHTDKKRRQEIANKFN